LYFLASYTWSKEIDNSGGNVFSGVSVTPPTTDNLAINRAVGTLNTPQAVSIACVYILPFGRGHALGGGDAFMNQVVGGWQLSDLNQYSAGAPLGAIGAAWCPIPAGATPTTIQISMATLVSMAPTEVEIRKGQRLPHTLMSMPSRTPLRSPLGIHHGRLRRAHPIPSPRNLQFASIHQVLTVPICAGFSLRNDCSSGESALHDDEKLDSSPDSSDDLRRNELWQSTRFDATRWTDRHVMASPRRGKTFCRLHAAR
jgi:hypothetical protein